MKHQKHQNVFKWCEAEKFSLWVKHRTEMDWWTMVLTNASYELAEKRRVSLSKVVFPSHRFKWQILPKGIEPYETNDE